MALCRRVVAGAAAKSRSISACSTSSPSSSLLVSGRKSGGNLELARRVSQLVKSNGKRAFLVDTLALVRGLEAQGVPSKQAEAITAAITEVLNDSLENVSHSFVSQSEMQKEFHFSMLQRETEKLRGDIEKIRSELRHEIDKVTAGLRLDLNLERSRIRDEFANQNAETTKFKSEVQSSQELHSSKLQRETEKLEGDLEKLRSELRHEIEKLTSGQRLDLNLEKGRIKDELANQNAETTNLTNKLDREIHALRAHLEASKYDVIKYCIGTLVSISAVGLAIVRILM